MVRAGLEAAYVPETQRLRERSTSKGVLKQLAG